MANNHHHLPLRCCGEDSADCEEEICQALVDTICGFYLEVLGRLPIQECPNLLHCLFIAGHCYGVLEPVSNIFLHAIAHGYKQVRCYSREHITDDFMNKVRRREYWRPAAGRSLEGLTTFLMSMYRYLARDQALRYLYLAQADIYLAINLVEQDFYRCRVQEELPPPDFDDDAWMAAIEDSVMYAALDSEHPNPALLVKLATKTFGADHIHKLAAWLHGDDHIDKAAVKDIYKSLIQGRDPDGLYLTSLRVVRYPEEADGAASHQSLKPGIHRCPSILKGRDGRASSPPCDYISRIEALLVDYIHALHLSAISRLSPDSVKLLHRGRVLAGYLYGPFEDPVFNILVNAIWYHINVPPDDNCMPSPPVHMICTDLMLRNGFNALAAQVAFLCSRYGSMLSGHDAMECLYSTNCNLRAAKELVEETGHHAGSNNLSVAIMAAVKAMKHPRPATMMALMDSFTPELEAKLCDLLPAKGHELTCKAIDNISTLLLSNITLPTIVSLPSPAITMHHGPWQR